MATYMDPRRNFFQVEEHEVRQFPDNFYYHYTPFATMIKIRDDGYLIPSTPHYKRNIGQGVYVTPMDPFNNPDILLRIGLFNGSGSPLTRSKLDCFFALHKDDVRNAAIVQIYPGRPDCIKLIPKMGYLYLDEIRHYSGQRLTKGEQAQMGQTSDDFTVMMANLLNTFSIT